MSESIKLNLAAKKSEKEIHINIYTGASSIPNDFPTFFEDIIEIIKNIGYEIYFIDYDGTDSYGYNGKDECCGMYYRFKKGEEPKNFTKLPIKGWFQDKEYDDYSYGPFYGTNEEDLIKLADLMDANFVKC